MNNESEIEDFQKSVLEEKTEKLKIGKDKKRIILKLFFVIIIVIVLGFFLSYFQTEYGIFYSSEKRKQISQNLTSEAENWINKADFPQTEKIAQRAVRHDKNNLEAYIILARSLYAQEKLEQSRDTYLAGLAQAPQDFRMNFYLGNVYRDLGELDTAEDYYNIALSIEPDNIECWINYALFYKFDRQDLEGVLKVYEQALKVNPDNERLQKLYDGIKEELETEITND